MTCRVGACCQGVSQAHAPRRRTPASLNLCAHKVWETETKFWTVIKLNAKKIFTRRQSTCMEQSSSRSAPIPDIYYFQNTPEVASVQPFKLSFPSVWLYYWLHHWLFLYRALEAAYAAYASLNLSLLHYITLHSWWYGARGVKPKIMSAGTVPLKPSLTKEWYNKLEMVATFIHKPSLVRIDERNFELSW